MKTIRRFLISVITLSILLTTITAYAASLWSEDYYRPNDKTGDMTELERNDLDDRACEFVETYGIDLVMVTLNSEDLDESLEEYAENYYKDNGFGYGDSKDGVILVYTCDMDEIAIVRFGAAETLIADDYIEMMKEEIPQYYNEYGTFGIMYAFERFMMLYMVDDLGLPPLASEADDTSAVNVSEDGDDIDAAFTDAEYDSEKSVDVPADGKLESKKLMIPDGGIARVGDSDPSLPYWYPLDPGNFQFYNEPGAPRIVDNADIFTDEEEAIMQDKISEYVPEMEKDIVIYTDTTAYGKPHEILAADFYDFNGYGIGPEHEGICLVICMDPDDRGWFATATGPNSRIVYTEDNANKLDDVLWDYMVSGAYGKGVTEWIDAVHNLYTTGMIRIPSWFTGEYEKTVRTPDADVARVEDFANAFTPEQRAALEAKAKKVSQAHGIDVVIHVNTDDCDMYPVNYTELFYDYHGYGFGEDKDGAMLTIFTDSEGIEMTMKGKARLNYTDVNAVRMYKQIKSKLPDAKYYEAADKWLDHLDKMQKNGRVPKPAAEWFGTGIFGALAGWFFGMISLAKAKRKMKTIKLADNADRFVDGAPRIESKGDIFLTRHTSTKRIERPTSSSSGSRSSSSSSSRSSYRSSYSGSSGRSHSGSGRRF